MKNLFSRLSNYIRSSIKRKFSLFFLLISSLLLLLYMGISIYWYRANMTSGLINSKFQEMMLARNSIDNALSYAEDLSVLLITNTEIQQELKNTANVRSSDILRVSNQMADIVGKFSIVSGVIICDLNEHVYDSGVVVVEGGLSEKMAASPGWHFSAPAPYYVPTTLQQKRPEVLSFTRVVNSYETGKRIGYLTLYIDMESIRQIYTSPLSTIQETELISTGDFLARTGDKKSRALSPKSEKDEVLSEGYVRTLDGLLLFDYYKPLDCYLVSTLDSSVMDDSIRQMIFNMVGVGFLLILLSFLASWSIAGHLTQDILHLYKGITQVESGNWSYHFESSSPDEIRVLADGLNNMVSTIQKTTIDLVNEQRKKRRYQLEMLDQQINPHFLYNTLDNICSLAELQKPEAVVDLTTNLARFYRGALSKGSFLIPLEEECKTAISYLRIMQTRYYQTFTYEFTVPERLSRNTILRLTLQPILENAVIHGFESHEPGGFIQICAEENGDLLEISVSDNGKGMTPEQVSRLYDPHTSTGAGGYALKNVQARIQLYFGQYYGIFVESRPDVGTVVRIKLPRQNL